MTQFERWKKKTSYPDATGPNAFKVSAQRGGTTDRQQGCATHCCTKDGTPARFLETEASTRSLPSAETLIRTRSFGSGFLKSPTVAAPSLTYVVWRQE
jgi:hypothetical protein